MSKYVRPAAEGADPFGTARLRRGVLDAWATSPARFREDANAEEDLVLGGYRDRLVVELAQNAADAAARAGVPGRLRLTLRDNVLVAANTGAPLDAAGVESLSTLRASAKRDAPDRAVGRFGVGFAAVLAVTDEPAVVGRHGGVRWSLPEARELAGDTARNSPGLGDEIRRRDGHVPLLRLPFPAEGTAPGPYDTAVILPLRDTAAADLAERLLDAVDDALLLALPGLEEVVVETGDAEPRTLSRRDEDGTVVVEDSREGATRWRTAAAHGPLTPDLLADRPVEERLRPHWSVTWAVPVDSDGGVNWEEDAPDAEELADVVLGLVRDAGLEPGDEPWLGALALPDEDGELSPACELVFPDGPFARVMREGELAAVDAELAARWGEQPLAACGVLVGFALVRATDVVLDPDELEPRDGDFAEPDDAGLLDAVDVWSEDVQDRFPDSPVPPVATEIVAVRDLDLVADDRWPQALALLSRPPLRDALVEQVRILLHDGTHEVVRPYTAWWLRGHPVIGGRRPAGLRAAGGDPLLRGLYDEADATGFEDEQVLRALGVRTSVAALLDEPGGAAELLDRLADPGRPVTAAQLHALYGALAELDPEQVTLPDDLRAVVDGRVEVVDAADAVVVDSPDLLPFTSGVPLLPVRPARAAELAELFQVRRLSESVTGGVDSEGAEHEVPEPVRVLLGPRTPASYVEHEELVVDGVEIDWRLAGDGVLHAATLEGVAAGLAWAAGQWPRRFEVAALLEDPSRTEELARDRWFD